MKYINLTPHKVVLMNNENKVIAEFESKGNVRVGMEYSYETKDGIPVGKIKYTELEGLPDPEKDTMYILSNIAFNAAKAIGRNDVCYPAGKMFRNEEGQIIGSEFLATEIC